MKILLLEDDQILCESLKEYLESDGFEVDVATRGDEVFELTYTNKYDLYLFDINVPDINGFEILKALKESGDNTPTIYITALTDIASLSKGFQLGAKDYIKKPFDPEELVVRIKSKHTQQNPLILHGNISYDPLEQLLRQDGERIILGEVQKNLFHLLLTHKDRVVNSFELMDGLEQPNANALRVNLTKLKNRLGIIIKNVRGEGYMVESL